MFTKLSKNMQCLFAITFLCSSILFICFAASPCLCARVKVPSNDHNFINVVDYGATGNGQVDDSQAFLKAWSNVCHSTQGTQTLLIPANKIFLLQPVTIKGPCNPSIINIKIEGTIIAPKSNNAWKFENTDKSTWIHFSYVNGLVINGGGLIDGQGASWWDCSKSNCQRPTALHFHNCENLKLDNLTHQNPPMNHIGIHGCNGTQVSRLHFVAPARSPNTDGIDISGSSNVFITNSTFETGDDCIAIKGGSSFINITAVNCGPGHGISIGSLGRGRAYDTVEEIHVRNCTFTNTENGARIKIWEGGSGYARKISYEDIVLVAAKNPVIINQQYDAFFAELNDQKAVKVSDITFKNFKGTSSVEDAIQLDCDKVVGCTNVELDKIHITSSIPGKETFASCFNAYGKSSNSNVPKVTCLKS